MGSAHEQYTKEMFGEFGYLATWDPGVPLQLGDVGLLQNRTFRRLGGLAELGIPFEARLDDTTVDLKYSSAKGVSFAFKAAGSAPLAGSSLSQAEAGLVVDMERKHSVVFEARGCRTHTILDQISLGSTILGRSQEQWNREWVVVTELIVASSATILVSRRSPARIELRAEGQLGRGALSLADLSAQFAVTVSRNIDTQIIAVEGLTPLFRASGIKRRLGRPPVFQPELRRHAEGVGLRETWQRENAEYGELSLSDLLR